jgi:hypothetical protein
MKLKMFTVRDMKVGFLSPFCMPTAGKALRAWEQSVNDEKSEFYKYPKDFIIYEMGEFDEETGRVEMYGDMKSLGSAEDYKKKTDDRKTTFADRLAQAEQA